MFAVGNAAHSMVEQLQIALSEQIAKGEGFELDDSTIDRVSARVLPALIAGGKLWEERPDPPIEPDAAREGIDLAIRFARLGLLVQSSDVETERAIGFDSIDGDEWTIASDFKAAKIFRLIFDAIWLEEDEDSGAVIAHARDYKTSWADDERALGSTQMIAQAIAALDVHPEADGVTIEIANLRTCHVHRETLDRHVDAQRIADYREHLRLVIRGLEAQPLDDRGRRPAVPSARCGGCRYLLACEDGRALMSAMTGRSTREEIVRAWVVAQGHADALETAARGATAEQSITIDGAAVGKNETSSTVFRSDAVRTLIDTWAGDREWSADLAAGLVLALRPGSTSIDHAIAAVYPGRGTKEARDRLREMLTTAKIGARWGAQRV